MELSPQGYSLLLQREGKRNEVYRDSEGTLTVGLGHCGPDVHEGEIWTDDAIEEAFQDDQAWVLGCLDAVSAPLEQNQFDALFSFIFNIGAGQWGSSTILRELNAGASAETVAREFDRWHIPPEIIPRRNGEKAQFLGTTFQARITNEEIRDAS